MAGMRDPLTEEPPPSRFDPDELDGFAPPAAAALTPPILEWSTSAEAHLQSGKLQPKLLIVALSRVGIHLVHHLPNKTPIGSITLPGISTVKKAEDPSPEDRISCIFSCNSNLSILLVSVQYRVPAEGANVWAKVLFQTIQPDRVLVLEHTPIHHFRGKLSVDEPSLFVLETDEQKLEDKDHQPVASYFPTGSLVDGLAAALLTHCQLRGLKGRLLLTWPAEDTSMVKMLVATLSKLLSVIPEGPDLNFQEAGKLILGKKRQAISEMYT